MYNHFGKDTEEMEVVIVTLVCFVNSENVKIMLHEAIILSKHQTWK